MNSPNTNVLGVVESPFGAKANLQQIMPTHHLELLYQQKCSADVSSCFHGLEYVGLYECCKTGYRFWRPESIAGNEEFYKLLSRQWPHYYREERWEYSHVRKLLKGKQSLLEIGCGKGYFLHSVENHIEKGMGIEFNQDAIKNKVTKLPIVQSSIQDFSMDHHACFDVVCCFQVLEHVVNPCSFIESALTCLVDGGILVISTPNVAYPPHRRQEDAFDLPPHHIGHFSSSIFQRISSYFGVDILETVLEPRRSPSTFTAAPLRAKSFLFQVVKSAFNLLRFVVYRFTRGTGANILVIFKK